MTAPHKLPCIVTGLYADKNIKRNIRGMPETLIGAPLFSDRIVTNVELPNQNARVIRRFEVGGQFSA